MALTGTAAVFDLRFRRIPNWLCVAGAASGCVANGMTNGWAGLGTALLGLGLALLIYVPLFLLRAMGGGDVKLMAAVGAVAGPSHWMAIFLITSLAGGALAIALLLWKGRLGQGLRNVGFILWELAQLRKPFESRSELDVGHPKAVSLPHGAMIALGSALFLLVMHR